MDWREYIHSDPRIMVGKPVIKGTRITVELILEKLAFQSVDEILLDYPHLKAERLEYWQKRAFREWALRPGPMMTYARMLLSDVSTLKSAVDVGLQHVGWGRNRAAQT